MKNLLSTYPTIYLLLFCAGSLLFGFEISEIYKHGFPKETLNYYLSISGLFFTAFLSFYFFYCFVKIKNKQAKNKSN